MTHKIGEYKHTVMTKKKISISNTGVLSSQWKGEEAKYQALHTWIRKYHGKANHCENSKCLKKSNEFQWALKPGKKYSRDINDYVQLCRSCHRKMDITTETRNKISKANTKNIGCKIKDCNGSHLSSGYCSHHYNVIIREKNKLGKTCSKKGCPNKYKCRGLCNTHYKQWLKAYL